MVRSDLPPQLSVVDTPSLLWSLGLPSLVEGVRPLPPTEVVGACDLVLDGVGALAAPDGGRGGAVDPGDLVGLGQLLLELEDHELHVVVGGAGQHFHPLFQKSLE